MKKKGLIISTVVMVLVLVAALSTATFAWFSSQANVTVDNLSVNTVASTGLEIAVKHGNADTDYVFGDLTWKDANAPAGNPNGFGGSEGWGSAINFDAITNSTSGTLGQIQNAVTRVKETSKDYAGGDLTGMVYDLQDNATMVTDYTLVSGEAFTEGAVNANIMLVKSVDGVNSLVNVTTADIYNTTGKYYKAGTIPANDEFLVPIGYNVEGGKLVPYGYVNATANENYLSLPISVRPTVDVKYIICSLTLTPGAGAMQGWDNYKPGMAAATYIEIAGNGQTTLLQPYSNVTTAGSAFNNKIESAFTFNFVVADNVAATEIQDYIYTIWIEGTDGQCINATAGSMFDINLEYNYIDKDGAVTETDKNTAVAVTTDNSGLVTMGSVSTKGKIVFGGKDYYMLDITKIYA